MPAQDHPPNDSLPSSGSPRLALALATPIQSISSPTETTTRAQERTRARGATEKVAAAEAGVGGKVAGAAGGMGAGAEEGVAAAVVAAVAAVQAPKDRASRYSRCGWCYRSTGRIYAWCPFAHPYTGHSHYHSLHCTPRLHSHFMSLCER